MRGEKLKSRPYGKHPPQPRPYGFNMRLSAEEFDKLEERAAEEGLTLSAWLRRQIVKTH